MLRTVPNREHRHPMRYPSIHLLPGRDRRLRAGHPWIYANEIRMDEAARALPPGSVVALLQEGKALALGHFNPHSLIASRVLTRNQGATIDVAFFERRLARALRLRERLFERPFYRLVHAEGDGLPGLVIDRFDDVLVCQLNTAGMAQAEAPLIEALRRLLAPSAVVLRNDSPVRELEGLQSEVRLMSGSLDGPIEVLENDLTFLADPLEGQKTGWYFDQRENRAFTARLAHGQRVLDLYSYSGGFTLAAAAGGAREVLAIDRSQAGLDLALASAERNGLADRIEVRRQEAFAALDQLASEKRRFGLVVCDPPAFVRSKRELKSGLRGYRKLARGAAGLLGEEGVLVIACCSHNVSLEAFAEEAWRGVREAGRGGRLLRQAGAGPDHPAPPALPESTYLKCLTYTIE
jgi:23S rRNA (cytosine1962-C5)-methyltransferase